MSFSDKVRQIRYFRIVNKLYRLLADFKNSFLKLMRESDLDSQQKLDLWKLCINSMEKELEKRLEK